MSIIFKKFQRDLYSELPKIAVSILIISMGIGGFITFFQVSENIKEAVTNAKSGQVEIRNDKDGNISLSIGKKSFAEDKLIKVHYTLRFFDPHLYQYIQLHKFLVAQFL